MRFGGCSVASPSTAWNSLELSGALARSTPAVDTRHDGPISPAQIPIISNDKAAPRRIRTSRDLHKALGRGATLRGADLHGADLEGADLDGATLDGATRRRASLREATLRGATVRRADLGRADLEGADLEEADLSG